MLQPPGASQDLLKKLLLLLLHNDYNRMMNDTVNTNIHLLKLVLPPAYIPVTVY